MKKKGQAMVFGIIGLLALVVVFGGFAVMSMQEKPPEDKDYNGAFATFQGVQELTGYNDLSVTAETLSDSNTAVDDGNVVSLFNINESNGDTIRYAFGVEIDGPMEEINVEMVEDITDSALDVKSLRLLRDEDDEHDLSSDQALEADFNVDEDDEVDETIEDVDKGDYVFVLEVRGTDTSQISTDADLYSFTLDATTDADSDEAEKMTVTIDNAA